MNKLRIMSVFGTRPEAIKMCPLVKELASRPEIESLCCVTAQHRQMLDSVLEVFEVKPEWDLDIMTPRQTLSIRQPSARCSMDSCGRSDRFTATHQQPSSSGCSVRETQRFSVVTHRPCRALASSMRYSR